MMKTANISYRNNSTAGGSRWAGDGRMASSSLENIACTSEERSRHTCGCPTAYRRRYCFRTLPIALIVLLLVPASGFSQNDKVQVIVTKGVERVRIAVADFKAANADPNTATLLTTFNQVLYSDLQNAGIFDVVSKSFNPLDTPSSPQDVKIDAWGNPPANAAMLAFGNLGVSGGQVAVYGWLYDVKNTVAPQVLGKQYREDATPDNARHIAHEFADEIIFRLGGGIPGVAESKIVFVSNRSGTKEIW